MENTTETPEVEEKNMPEGLKIFLLIVGFLISLVGLYFTIDLGSVGEFLDIDSVKHGVLLISLTALVVIGFNLYRAFFGHDEHAKKHTEEILLSGIHFNYPALVLFPDKYLKGVEIDSKEAKQFHNYYITGLVMLSALVMTVLVPLCTLCQAWFENFPPDGYDENGEPYNNIASALYAAAYLFRGGVVLFWAASFTFGLKGVHQGHKALVLVNGKIILRKKAGSGVVLTFPFLFKSIKLWQVKSEIIISTVLDVKSEPKILTGSAQSSLYEVGYADMLRPVADGAGDRLRFFNDIFHTNRRFIKYLEMTGIFSLGDQVTFYEKKCSMEEVESVLKVMMESARLEVLGDKSYAQTTGTKPAIENRMTEALMRELKGYDNCLGVKNVLVNKIDFDRAIEEVDVVKTTIKPVEKKAAA